MTKARSHQQWDRAFVQVWQTSASDDVQRHRGLHLGVQPNQRLVAADRLDRVRDLDLALVELRAAGGLDGGSDIGGRHRAEQATGVTSVGDDLDGLVLEVAPDRLGLLEGVDRTDLAALGDRLDLLLPALGPRGGQATAEQEVAGVAVLDVDDVTGVAEGGHLVGQNDLHLISSFPWVRLSGTSWS